MGSLPEVFLHSSTALGSFLKSIFVPTRRIGVVGHLIRISSTHFLITLSALFESTIEKQTKKISVPG